MAENTISPVYLDGPAEGEQHPVPLDHILEQGMITYDPPLAHDEAGAPQVVYSFTRVQVFGRTVVVASVHGGIPDQGVLFDALLNSSARRAAE